MDKRERTLAWLLLLLAVCVMAVSMDRLWEIRQMEQAGEEVYETMADKVKKPKQGRGRKEAMPQGAKTLPVVEIPSLDIDFGALKAINPDAVGWLYGPDTRIDYPVMRADDYNWYLHHLPDGTYNANGSLFLDYNNPSDFSGRLSIIYGHHMKSGKMFASLTKYKEQEYFDGHPYLYLYTEEENYRAELLYGCVVDAKEWRKRAFMFENNLSALLAYAAHHTTFTSHVSYKEEDRFLVLSTCSYEFDDARYIVLGVLQPEYGK
mgnify:CR=1 FL=1